MGGDHFTLEVTPELVLLLRGMSYCHSCSEVLELKVLLVHIVIFSSGIVKLNQSYDHFWFKLN